MLCGMTDATTPAGWYDDPTSPGVMRWWDGSQWGEQRAPKVQGPTVVVQQRKMYKTSHGFHLIMSILTLGLWAIFVWLPVGIYNAAKSS